MYMADVLQDWRTRETGRAGVDPYGGADTVNLNATVVEVWWCMSSTEWQLDRTASVIQNEAKEQRKKGICPQESGFTLSWRLLMSNERIWTWNWFTIRSFRKSKADFKLFLLGCGVVFKCFQHHRALACPVRGRWHDVGLQTGRIKQTKREKESLKQNPWK